MILWLVLALMTAAAIFAVLWPLSRRTALRAGSDIAVYRDQLDEIERDRAAGLIGEDEADAARVEVSRRLIAAADAVDSRKLPDGARWRRRAAARRGLGPAAARRGWHFISRSVRRNCPGSRWPARAMRRPNSGRLTN